MIHVYSRGLGTYRDTFVTKKRKDTGETRENAKHFFAEVGVDRFARKRRHVNTLLGAPGPRGEIEKSESPDFAKHGRPVAQDPLSTGGTHSTELDSSKGILCRYPLPPHPISHDPSKSILNYLEMLPVKLYSLPARLCPTTVRSSLFDDSLKIW